MISHYSEDNMVGTYYLKVHARLGRNHYTILDTHSKLEKCIEVNIVYGFYSAKIVYE